MARQARAGSGDGGWGGGEWEWESHNLMFSDYVQLSRAEPLLMIHVSGVREVEGQGDKLTCEMML